MKSAVTRSEFRDYNYLSQSKGQPGAAGLSDGREPTAVCCCCPVSLLEEHCPASMLNTFIVWKIVLLDLTQQTGQSPVIDNKQARLVTLDQALKGLAFKGI